MTDMPICEFENPAEGQVVQRDYASRAVGMALPVMEHFYTLQGEGYHWGKVAYFIRLGGCNVGCVWCDVKESWGATKRPVGTIKFLISERRKTPWGSFVVPGGDPLLHDLAALTKTLHQDNLKAHIEASGSAPLSVTCDWISLSPRKFK